MVKDRIDLLSNAGLGAGSAKECFGGKHFLVVDGTPNDADFALEVQIPTGDWVPVPGLTITGNDDLLTVYLPAGQVRMNVTDGGTNPSGMYAYLIPA